MRLIMSPSEQFDCCCEVNNVVDEATAYKIPNLGSPEKGGHLNWYVGG